MTDFTQLTTMRVGGPVHRLIEATDADTLVAETREAWASDEPWLILGGGSNLIVGDDGFDGTVIRVATRGIERIAGEVSIRPQAAYSTHSDPVVLRVQAGESWDGLVEHTIEQGLTGIEALSGIPGLVGAAPIQNIGAYGQELSDCLISIDFLDLLSGELTRIPAAELKLGYRTSAIKQGRHGLVIAVELQLTHDPLGAPVAYEQLAATLGVQLGDRVPAADVRAAVLKLRASKGMVLSPDDPDSVSAGSFFTNPIVGAAFAAELPSDAPRWPVGAQPADLVVPLDEFRADALPAHHLAEQQVKLSAAWLIERSGISRGFSLPGSAAAVSSKHTLAIVNSGGATAAQVAELARYIQTRVMGEFGVLLQPEPVLVGVQL